MAKVLTTPKWDRWRQWWERRNEKRRRKKGLNEARPSGTGIWSAICLACACSLAVAAKAMSRCTTFDKSLLNHFEAFYIFYLNYFGNISALPGNTARLLLLAATVWRALFFSLSLPTFANLCCSIIHISCHFQMELFVVSAGVTC